MKSGAIVLALLAVWPGVSWAHEMRPGYLEVKEVTPATYSVLWKVPTRGDRRLPIAPRFPASCQDVVPTTVQRTGGALISRSTVRCTGGLAGQNILIKGLEGTLTDVLARVVNLDNAVQTVRLTPGQPAFSVTDAPDKLALSGTYLRLGIEHILWGIDHLLFVLALLMIVGDRRRLVFTVTAFTVAHSIALAAATLGWVHIPQQPVEAVIALSIVFLASEIIRGLRGRPALTARRPWIVAFVFGLLHGLGFAGALREIGLPDQAIPLALLFFNVGVEVGQLVFIAGVLAAGWAIQSIRLLPAHQSQSAVGYAIGGIAAMWTIERVAAFWA